MIGKTKDPHDAGLFVGCCELFSDALVGGHPHAVEGLASIAAEVPDAIEVEALASTAAAEQLAPLAAAVAAAEVEVPACSEAQDGTAAAERACSEAAQDGPAALVEAEAGPVASGAALAVSVVEQDEPEAVVESACSPAASAGLVAVRACCQAGSAVFVDLACCRDGPVESAAVPAGPLAEPVWSVAVQAVRGESRADRALILADQDVLVESAVGCPAALGE
jgi:hypothetical protein